MLYFEPVSCREAIPDEILETVKGLSKRGFNHPFTGDLELVNIGRPFPLVEKDGKFIYRGTVVGYLRGLQSPLPSWI
jgi:hypothetical protein